MGDQFKGEKETSTSEEYRQVLRDIVFDLDRPNLFLVEGPELLSNLGGLFQDLIHPGARGMIEMGENLARELKPIVSSVAASKFSQFHWKEYA